MREFLAFHLHTRSTSQNHLFKASKLFHEYLVDSWAICEQQNLNYIRFNQGGLCTYLYSALATTLQQNSQAGAADVGTRIILPTTFTGSTRHMQANCQDALALNRHFQGADFFITMTANPNWEEIRSTLMDG